ncbi:ABC transporter ATP-binding protein [Enterococcus sp. CSURQ0835]|uniref:ABC transporter ATP-binding protein n=1 Tax=Enterococcus sp. CSURQ0835 TaxID=2681394 RepID=UPI0013582F92|nr:ABC transporter ATP-binding protein [Enterococcus sp. CSURQ0835]
MIFEANNLSININKKIIISDFSLSVSQGEFVFVIGKSGSGKTTLINTLSLLNPSYSGDLMYFGTQIDRKYITHLRRNVISYMFQNYGLLDNETVWENLKIASRYNKAFQKESLLQLISDFSLPASILNEKVYQLSGGEQQRVALIRTLIKPYDIIFADEPTGNLDRENAEFILNYLHDLVENQKKSVVMVTHENSYSNYATSIVDLN